MLRPIQDKVVLKLKDEKEVTKGGIILTSNTKTQSQLATVVAVGPGAIVNGIRMIMEVKEKDIVFVKKDSGIKIEHEGEEYIIVNQNEILSVIR